MWVTRSGTKTGDNCCPSPGARGGARAAGAVWGSGEWPAVRWRAMTQWCKRSRRLTMRSVQEHLSACGRPLTNMCKVLCLPKLQEYVSYKGTASHSRERSS